jgi:hypothetical protein
MAITQTATTSFKIELLQGVHNFGPTSPDTFKIALYTEAATLGATTTAYTSSGEVVGTGYTATGKVLTITTSPTSGTNSSNVIVAYISFADVTWTNSTFTSRGALIYNSSKSNKSVAVLNFGSDKTVNNDTFQVLFPTPDANSAIVRIA